MSMLIAFKYRLYPTDIQCSKLNQTFGSVRCVYNWALNLKSKAYKEHGIKMSYNDTSSALTALKKSEETSWLYEVHSNPLQQTLRDLQVAYTNFFRGNAKYPTFKKKKNRNSFRHPSSIKVDNNKVWCPKIGWIRFNRSRSLRGVIRSATFSITPTGKYFASILCETGLDKPIKQPIKESTSVGIDLGIKTFAVTSDAEIFENQEYLQQSLSKLRIAQRSLSRKKKGGSNRNKQRVIVAKLHEKVDNQRKDYLHKLSTTLVCNYDTICIEDLNVSGMLKNPRLSRHIADVGFRSFRTMLEYKCEWYGKNLSVINQWTPSSKLCSSCGNLKNTLTLSERTYKCDNCGTEIDRDYNAALNIKYYGLDISPLGDINSVTGEPKKRNLIIAR